MMFLVLSALAVAGYSMTGALHLSELMREHAGHGRVAKLLPWVSVGLNAAVLLLLIVLDGWSAPLRAGRIFGVLALVLAVGYLSLRAKFDLRGAGTVVAPACAILVSMFLVETHAALPDGQGTGFLLTVHIALAILGLGAFVLAGSLAVLYLVQERQLRRREFGRLFQRLPSLGALDVSQFRLTALGFVLYTIAVVLGGVEMQQRDGGSLLDFRIITGAVSWLIFAAILHTRITSGWRGRAAAWLTLTGCFSAIALLGFYAV